MASRSAFRWQEQSLVRGVKEFSPKLDRVIAGAVDYTGTEAVGQARANARWQDRTGNARNGLGVEYNHQPMVRHGFALYHSVPYGIWLEVRWSGKYAIIKETTQRAFKSLMGRVRSGMVGMR